MLALPPAIAAAFVYAQLSGFALPAQRAFWMLLLAALLRWFYGRVPLSLLFACVLLLLLLPQPLMLRSAGLHLSFLAVAILLWQNQAPARGKTAVWQWGRAQLLVTAFLTPVLLYWFGQASLLAPVANAVAIPLVSLILVPLVLILLLLLAMGLALPTWLLALPGVLLQTLDVALDWLHALGTSALQLFGQPSLLVLILALTAIALVAAPRGFPGRVLAPLLLLPLCLPATTPQGEVRLTMLDVGQGLALVFEADGKVLVFDSGPRFASGFDAGQAVLLPYLRMRGYRNIDVLVVSHGDLDHAGGTQALSQLPITRHWHGEPARNNYLGSPSCHQAPAWRWQTVSFEFLPLPTVASHSSLSSNNRSCVLAIRAGGQRLLLAGDIEADAERALLAAYGREKLAADILLAPHHGSKTSSSAAFLAAVAPRWVLVSSGFHNHFGHPASSVLQRYRQQQAQVLNTAVAGAVTLHWSARDEGPVSIVRQRSQAGNFWLR